MGERDFPSPYKEWADEAEAQGWTIKSGTSHIKWLDSEGRLMAIMPRNRTLKDADKRRALNFRANLRRAGLSV